jgi:YD repeat-containing protein
MRKAQKNVLIDIKRPAIYALMACIFLIQMAPVCLAEVTLLPGQGTVLIKHQAGSIAGYPIYVKYRPSEMESAAGSHWISSLDIFFRKDKSIPLAIVQADGELFVFEEVSAGHFAGSAAKIRYLVHTDDVYRLAMRGGKELLFSPKGELTEIRSDGGKSAKIFTDQRSKIIGWTTAGGEGGTVKWYRDGNLATVRTPLDLFIYEYEDGTLTAISNEKGDIWQYQYDQKGRPIHVSEPDKSYNITYDAKGRVHILEDPEGETLLVEYENQGKVQVVDVWSSAGKRTTYTFSGNLTTIAEGPRDDDPVKVTEINLSTGKMVVSEKGGRRVELMPASDGNFELFSQIPRQLPVRSRIGSNGQVLNAKQGNIKFQTISATPDKPIKPQELNVRNAMVRTPDGKISKIILGGQQALSYEYNQRGAVSKIGLPNGSQALFEYDSRRRLTRYTDVFGATRTYLYDDDKGVLTEKLPNGQTWTSRYDAENRLLERRLPLGRTINYQYDNDGALSGVTLGKFDTQEWFSSRLDDISSYTSSLLGNWFFINLDDSGSTKRISPGGGLVSYLTDPDSRLVRIEDSQQNPLASYGYDRRGDLVEAQTDSASLRLTYDKYRRIKSEEDTAAGLSWRYSYNAAGLINRLQDSDGHSVKYTFNETGKLSEIRSSQAGVFKIHYGKLGLPVRLVRPNGVITQWNYDVGGRLQALTHVLPDGDTLFEKHQYDQAGNLAALSRSDHGRTRFTYDELSQLKAVRPDKGKPVEVAYDAWGNLLRFGEKTFTYSQPGRLKKAGGVTVATDEANRILGIQNQGGSVAFSYDWDERISRVTQNNKVVGRWDYGPLGRVVSAADHSGTVRRYLYAMQRLYAVKQQKAKSATKYIIAPGIEDCVAVIRAGGGVQYPLADSQGTILYLTDPQGKIIASREFDFWGVPQGKDPLNLSLGYGGGLSFLDGQLLFLQEQQYWLPFARALTGPAIQPGSTGLREINPLAFVRGNLNHAVE